MKMCRHAMSAVPSVVSHYSATSSTVAQLPVVTTLDVVLSDASQHSAVLLTRSSSADKKCPRVSVCGSLGVYFSMSAQDSFLALVLLNHRDSGQISQGFFCLTPFAQLIAVK